MLYMLLKISTGCLYNRFSDLTFDGLDSYSKSFAVMFDIELLLAFPSKIAYIYSSQAIPSEVWTDM